MHATIFLFLRESLLIRISHLAIKILIIMFGISYLMGKVKSLSLKTNNPLNFYVLNT